MAVFDCTCTIVFQIKAMGFFDAISPLAGDSISKRRPRTTREMHCLTKAPISIRKPYLPHSLLERWINRSRREESFRRQEDP